MEYDSEALTRAMQRVSAEFREMPGLTLTVAQAARLWAFDTLFCQAVLAALVDADFLVRTRHLPISYRYRPHHRGN